MSRYDDLAKEFAEAANELDRATGELVRARRVFAEARRKLVMSRRIVKTSEFTGRELEVIQCSLSEWSQGEISRELNISVRTVKFHLTNIYNKLNITSKWELAEALLRKHPEIYRSLTGSKDIS